MPTVFQAPVIPGANSSRMLPWRPRASEPLSHSSSISPLTSCDDAAERDRARGRESLVALELALRQGLADGLLDLALRAQPQRFEKFADAAVEDVFVHDRILCGAYFIAGATEKQRG